MIERNRRLRYERRMEHMQYEARDRFSPLWFWTQIVKAARAGQGWFVISLAGAPFPAS